MDYGYHESEERSAVVHVEHQINQCKMFTSHPKHLVNQFKITGAEMETDKENLWTLIIEIYSAFRKFFETNFFKFNLAFFIPTNRVTIYSGGSTVVLKSEGAVKHHQADVLGVYRMVDNYNDRPVYKQDGGENFIYYR